MIENMIINIFWWYFYIENKIYLKFLSQKEIIVILLNLLDIFYRIYRFDYLSQLFI